MTSHFTQEAFHKIIEELTKNFPMSEIDLDENALKSFVYLDAKTINLLLLYILMNKELQMTRLNARSQPNSSQKSMGEQIDRMISENEKIFGELINELKSGL
ncbi:hypothetical protein QWT69_01415 [Sporosarcina oncorhynchi]|uniref:Uncharacterized protein n=1 Tax=Sporosarcina oncorhynchi TaxID=3056444 RepID=A0ABZ0L7A4_9BACL|nr:hypothetical protein [Sporosarcina sp. T2O-4]WOV87808.1 hypothetical protein QWT69_01415 [Sporosarcina sp. T2O-4]